MRRTRREPFVEYFNFERHPDLADRTVTRAELLRVLRSVELERKARRWHRRLWRLATSMMRRR
jgi:hypothetical protein